MLLHLKGFLLITEKPLICGTAASARVYGFLYHQSEMCFEEWWWHCGGGIGLCQSLSDLFKCETWGHWSLPYCSHISFKQKSLPAFIKCSKSDYLIIGFINFLSFPSFSFCLQSSGIPEESSLKTYFNQSRKISIDRICTWFCCGRYQKLHSLMFGGVGVVNN